MSDFPRGLYESIITDQILRRLEALPADRKIATEPLREAEFADRLALHLQSLVRRSFGTLRGKHKVARGIALLRQLAHQIGEELGLEEARSSAPVETGALLRAVLRLLPDGKSYEELSPPLTPLLDTTLLSNAPGEPALLSQIQSEIESSDRIDVLMAFITRGGVVPLRSALRRHVAAGRPLRILTTTFTGTTQARALDDLVELGADLRISYDTGAQRLHAKTWLFHRDSGYSTAYVGSSNLTHHGQRTGLEWNIRLSGARNPDVLGKMHAVFESHWEGGDFVPYVAEEFRRHLSGTLNESRPRVLLSGIELRPEPFQERMLEQLAVAREQGQHRNLLVAATGTGKTVMAALDYAQLRREMPRARLLFVAHRKEILEQSRATFCHAVRDPEFGESWVDGQRPADFEQVFASIQSLARHGVGHIDPEHFDVLVIDEFHHAAARSYDQLLEHLRPRELLGLTATPERSDGTDILQHFGGRITAELRLWDAIDRQYLVPFLYYGIHDAMDLRDIPWKRGRGYDTTALTGLLTSSDAWAAGVLRELEDRVDDLSRIRALGFCVGVEHAKYMTRFCSERGLPSRLVTGDTPAKERSQALASLASGQTKVLFSVDVFGEGVDLPEVDTLLLLRPTESPVLFLQQLGRGLRKARGKSHCTVLDFVGTHRREFRFDRKLRALLGGTRKDVQRQVEDGFPFLPAGCLVQLDQKSREIVLRSIRNAVPSNWQAKAQELRDLASRSGVDVRLPEFLAETGLDLEDVYSATEGRSCWTDLRRAAGLPTAQPGPDETVLCRALQRLLHVDDSERIESWLGYLAADGPPDVAAVGERERRLLHMLVAELLQQLWKGNPVDPDLGEAAARLWEHPALRDELRELLGVLKTRIDHVHRPLDARHVPLQVHARYTRNEILAAFGSAHRTKLPSWMTGVRYEPHARADLLAFTLDKTGGGFSPTTRYEDYALSPTLVHWQSQNIAHPGTETGHRYIHHESMGTTVHLFARQSTDTRAFWYLGPATYVRHEGERPMSILWQLEHALSGDMFAEMRAAAG